MQIGSSLAAARLAAARDIDRIASRFQLLNMRLARPPEWSGTFYREKTFGVVCFGGEEIIFERK